MGKPSLVEPPSEGNGRQDKGKGVLWIMFHEDHVRKLDYMIHLGVSCSGDDVFRPVFDLMETKSSSDRKVK